MDLQYFYVSHNGQDMGPFSIAEIVGKVSSGDLLPTDYVYDETKEDWILLMEHEAVAVALKAKKPKAPPKAKEHQDHHTDSGSEISNTSSEERNLDQTDEQPWYVLKGENKYGPFAYLDLIRMLQEKVIYEFDYVWNKNMEGWQRVAELDEFSAERIRTLKDQKKTDAADIFFRRRHSRVSFGGSILVHDNKQVWKGKGINISAGGAAILMENAMILPGQTLYLHFKPGDDAPPFNAICEVVNKRYESDVRHQQAPVLYGVKFTNISSEARAFINAYTKEETKKSA